MENKIDRIIELLEILVENNKKKPELIQTFEKDFEKFNLNEHQNYTYQ